MIARIMVIAVAVAVISPGTVAQQALEPLSVWGLNQDASYYDQKEIAVSGYVVDSDIEWYGSSGSDYMTWNLLIADVLYPDESNHVLLCYESGFNIDRMRECSEIAGIQKDLERMVTVVGEYDRRKGILNLRKFMYFEGGEPVELDTDVADREHVRVYRTYYNDFDYDIHYTVWYRHSYIWPHPVWWLWWEPIYVVRPPTHYVYYHTPWRTYSRRVHPRPGITRGFRDAIGPGYGSRPIPSGTRGVVRGTPVGPSPRGSGRVRVSPPARRSDTNRVAPPSRVRAGPRSSSPPERTQSPDRTPAVRERNESGGARPGPTEAPTRVRSAPSSRSGSSSAPGRTRSSQGTPAVRERSESSAGRHARAETPTRVRSAPPARLSSSSGGSSGHSARVSSPRGSSSGTRSSVSRGSSSGTRSSGSLSRR